jgi:general secretion pathway protein D
MNKNNKNNMYRGFLYLIILCSVIHMYAGIPGSLDIRGLAGSSVATEPIGLINPAEGIVENNSSTENSSTESLSAAIIHSDDFVSDEKIEKILDLPEAEDDFEINLDEDLVDQEYELESQVEERAEYPYSSHMKEFLQPWDPETEKELTTVNFQNASLSELMAFMQTTYNVTFLTDEALDPLPKGGVKLSASTINFKSHVPLNKKELWELFNTFLDIAGFALVPGNNPRIFKIVNSDPKISNKMSLPNYIGVDFSVLPDSDIKIRYVYFVANADINNLLPIIDKIRSPGSSPVLTVPEMRAIILTDKSSLIKSIMEIVTQLDTVACPETMSIIRLKKASATDVVKFYESLTKEEGANTFMARMNPQKKESSMHPFSRVRVVAEPRQNLLIAFGSREAVALVEEFIKSNIDKDIAAAYSSCNIYHAKYVDAVSTAELLKKLTKFDPTSDAARYGGIRDGEKYFKNNLDFVAEKATNSIVIRGDYDDYLKIIEMLKKIDIEQPQVAIKVAIVNVDISDVRGLGAQIRNTNYGINNIPGATGLNGIAGTNFAFQTSGVNGSGIVENPNGTGVTRLLGDLVKLATLSQQGSTMITLANDTFGLAGILQILQTYTKSTVVASPFLVTTHNYPASIVFGQERRVAAGTVTGGGSSQDAITPIQANLLLKIKPIISSGGAISLDVEVQDNKFTGPVTDSKTAGDRTEKHVTTKALIRDKGVLALGGFVTDSVVDVERKVPIFGDIPVVGWLFKTKLKTVTKSSLLILISAEILPTEESKNTETFTQEKIEETRKNLQEFDANSYRDPIYTKFFSAEKRKEFTSLDQFVKGEGAYISSEDKKYKNPQEQSVQLKGKKLTRLLDLDTNKLENNKVAA